MNALVRPDLTAAAEVDWLGQAGAEKPRRKVGAPERQAQRAVIAWIRAVCPGAVVAAITNEERGAGRTTLQRARFGLARKRSGVVTGMPDVLVLLDGGRVLLIEMKAPGGGVLSEAQAELHGRLRALGHTVGVATSIETARGVLLGAGVPLREAAGQAVGVAKVRTVRAKSRVPADQVPL